MAGTVSARAWSARRCKLPPGRYVPKAGAPIWPWQPYTRAELARERRTATQQRRIDRRWDRHDAHGGQCALRPAHAMSAQGLTEFLAAMDAATAAAQWQRAMVAQVVELIPVLRERFGRMHGASVRGSVHGVEL